MIRQGLVQEKVADLAMGSQLPQLNSNYPQWARVNTLDKARYPKPFVKDRLMASEEDKKDEDGFVIDNSEMNPTQRILYLERSLLFLRHQHQDVLRSLHEEIESLKRDNKDLQFKIVMSQKPYRSKKKTDEDHGADGKHDSLSKDSSLDSFSKDDDDSLRSRDEKLDEIKVVFLEEEIKELKHGLRETRNRNTYLTQLLEQSEEQRKRQQASMDTMKYQSPQESNPTANISDQITTGNGLLQTNGRPLTLAECHAIIRQQKNVMEQQTHELESLKSDLRDVLYSHKWTPDAYLLAKAYIAADDLKHMSTKSTLPRIQLKQQTRKLPEGVYLQDTLTLPALKQTVSNKAIERRKRTQILQKARLRKEVLP
ncbi:coiled-coil domain-containing protein 74B-like [Gigantopelta aegis]|uniref:coiled-coil domain-containing protein 74B-like n=1 Tax=Gigantopelta aegis TaxID=1735272 RepID=UPI001B887CE7|nr:coiled-coil domain-containing protein 74B-like [Gigantopelta aegis]